MTTIPELWKEIDTIRTRNARVEMDKAREVSRERKLLIAVMTYLVIVLFFYAAHLVHPWINAIVPCVGFFLSTLTIPFAKKMWIRQKYKQ